MGFYKVRQAGRVCKPSTVSRAVVNVTRPDKTLRTAQWALPGTYQIFTMYTNYTHYNVHHIRCYFITVTETKTAEVLNNTVINKFDKPRIRTHTLRDHMFPLTARLSATPQSLITVSLTKTIYAGFFRLKTFQNDFRQPTATTTTTTTVTTTTPTRGRGCTGRQVILYFNDSYAYASATAAITFKRARRYLCAGFWRDTPDRTCARRAGRRLHPAEHSRQHARLPQCHGGPRQRRRTAQDHQPESAHAHPFRGHAFVPVRTLMLGNAVARARPKTAGCVVPLFTRCYAGLFFSFVPETTTFITVRAMTRMRTRTEMEMTKISVLKMGRIQRTQSRRKGSGLCKILYGVVALLILCKTCIRMACRI
jgi:hypothetical protein